MHTIAISCCFPLPSPELENTSPGQGGKPLCGAQTRTQRKGSIWGNAGPRSCPAADSPSRLAGLHPWLPWCQGPGGWQHTPSPAIPSRGVKGIIVSEIQIVLSHTLCNMTSRRPKYAPGGGARHFPKAYLAAGAPPRNRVPAWLWPAPPAT